MNYITLVSFRPVLNGLLYNN